MAIQCERKKIKHPKVYCFASVSMTTFKVLQGDHNFLDALLGDILSDSLISAVSQFGTGSGLDDEVVSAEISFIVCVRVCVLYCVQPFW